MHSCPSPAPTAPHHMRCGAAGAGERQLRKVRRGAVGKRARNGEQLSVVKGAAFIGAAFAQPCRQRERSPNDWCRNPKSTDAAAVTHPCCPSYFYGEVDCIIFGAVNIVVQFLRRQRRKIFIAFQRILGNCIRKEREMCGPKCRYRRTAGGGRAA